MSGIRLLDLYAQFFARKSLYRFNRMLFHASMRGMGILNYKSAALSGEQRFLRDYVAKRDAPVIFDVGANEGSYAADVLAENPRARIFAFEPHPRTYTRLSKRMSGHTNVMAVNAGCGSATGRLVLYDYAGSEGSAHASLHPGVIETIHHGSSEPLEVDVITLDEFAATNRISSIDLLKIDTEGNELEVLKGASRLLSEGRVEAIQFEFNEMNLVSRVFLKDFANLLTGHTLYRMVPDGLVALGSYWPPAYEIFAFQNIVALPKQKVS